MSIVDSTTDKVVHPRATGRAQHILMGVLDSTGTIFIPLDSLAQFPSKNADGSETYITAGPDSNGYSFRQTTYWLNGEWNGITGWVKL